MSVSGHRLWAGVQWQQQQYSGCRSGETVKDHGKTGSGCLDPGGRSVTMGLTKIEKEIVGLLEKELMVNKKYFNQVGSSTRALKTINIKSALNKLGRKRGHVVYTSYNKRSLTNLRKKLGNAFVSKIIQADWPHEWLFDLCWARHSGDPKDKDWWKTLKHLELACEIELVFTEDAILEDFQKLIVCDSKLRLIVFQYGDEESDADSIIKMCQKYSPERKNFRYLAVAFPQDLDKAKNFVAEAWT